jgi:hypothetical protein
MLSRPGQERTKLQRLLAEVPDSRQDRLRSLRFKLKSIDKKLEEWSMW